MSINRNRQIITVTRIKERYGWISCMSRYQIEFNNQIFRTCEAFFQFLRFEGHPDVQQLIIEQKSPMGAKMKARKHRELLNRGIKWDESPSDIELMRFCLKLKLEQHPELKSELLATGNAFIIEDCTTHDRESARFWGMVKSGNQWVGENILGKLWMEIREEIRSSEGL